MVASHVYPPTISKKCYTFRKMPKPKHDLDSIVPATGMVLLQRDVDTPGGAGGDSKLYIPRSVHSDAAYYGVGRVIAVGPLMTNYKGHKVDFGLTVGDVVLYSQHECQAVRFDLARNRRTILIEQHYVKCALAGVEVIEID